MSQSYIMMDQACEAFAKLEALPRTVSFPRKKYIGLTARCVLPHTSVNSAFVNRFWYSTDIGQKAESTLSQKQACIRNSLWEARLTKRVKMAESIRSLGFDQHWHSTRQLQISFRHASQSIHCTCYSQLLVSATLLGFQPSTNTLLALLLLPIKVM